MTNSLIDRLKDGITESLEQYQENLEEATEMSWWVILVLGAFVGLAWLLFLLLVVIL